MSKGTECKACPVCSGQIIVSDHWMFSCDQLLGKRGKLLKKRTRSVSGPMECQTAYCLDCKEVWNADEFMIDEEDRFIDFKNRGNE